ncbi:hypothetical protein ACFFOM_06590 [Microlunatus capsulatus]|uniref:Uncharacterized protein n=1 Tax=Microlunatus capsulatus TaxID=99117 RepID=A0ABS4Z5S6_9ACTN|nr:hypothetical protein [Microlunatus capsulatus]MBP2416386.1 hypothetical protein [Microlunatus capsulatus]
MIPQDWTPVHRPEDSELVGYLVPGDAGSTPVTLFGHPLGGPADDDEAEELLRRRGLAVLADPWWLDGAADEPVRVQILSADRTGVVVARADFGFVSHDAERYRLPVPTDRLRPLR